VIKKPRRNEEAQAHIGLSSHRKKNVNCSLVILKVIPYSLLTLVKVQSYITQTSTPLVSIRYNFTSLSFVEYSSFLGCYTVSTGKH
jgi:hypothetical protein